MTNVWNALALETSKSPDVSLFHRFKNHFPLLAYDVNNLNFTDFLGSLLERKADIVNMCKSFLSNNSKCCRGDYKELVLLALLYLTKGGAVPGFTSFSRPGALHKAR